MEPAVNNIEIVKERTFISAKNRIKILVASKPQIKILLITDLALLSHFQELKNYPIVDIISIDEKECDKKASFLINQLELIKDCNEKVLITNKENNYEKTISVFHVILLFIGLLYLALVI